ncbi:SDR family NAD(P)-dependent oxidoreductase [Mycolicibacterium sp. 050158]|uniref:SDR family NAD(P)-dependent oxidoreductase n=1 Tax=Mycolicibacterium sp. 050158 TaxID=3090602 RepID=UPI00299E3A13|nr:SDR family NAD(P)-dependent oxidoreductase [Mycolicibacterium sp. 050158]MDX1891970.1 SDR family NAD(P)-dependent oxidoreductase [Mycolicibacterium sp. 050158]
MTSPPATPGGYSHPAALAGHTVIVTGAAQGVGKGIAGALLDRGASVLLVDHDAHTLHQTGDEFSTAAGEFEVMVADLRDPGSPRAIVETAVRRFGGLDALVNDAIATNEPKPLVDITSDDYDLVFDVGPRATFFLMQAAHPVLKAGGGGVIVNLGSASGTGGQARFAAYAAAKEAIRGMSKAAALEWGRDAVNVNVVCPFADSPGVRFWQDVAPKDFERALRGVPLGRVGRTREDIGAVVAFLVSQDGRYITGQTIMVDGGMGVFR